MCVMMMRFVSGNCVFMIDGCMVHDIRGHGECVACIMNAWKRILYTAHGKSVKVEPFAHKSCPNIGGCVSTMRATQDGMAWRP